MNDSNVIRDGRRNGEYSFIVMRCLHLFLTMSRLMERRSLVPGTCAATYQRVPPECPYYSGPSVARALHYAICLVL